MKNIPDEKIKGLHTRIRPNGTRAYFLYYRSKAGVQRRPKIGEIPAMTVLEARKIAKDILNQVAAGKDPSQDWQDLKKEPTIHEMFCSTWNNHWNKPRFQKSGWAQEVDNNYRNHIKPKFGHMKVTQVRPSVVREWHIGMEATPIAANRSLEILSKMFHYSEQMEIIYQNSNPCKLVTHYPEKKRKRFATTDEINKIGVILKREYDNHPREVAFIILLMLTGSRPKALECSTWNNLKIVEQEDGRYGVFTFNGKSTSNTGEEEVIVFPPNAMAIVDTLHGYETIPGINMPRKFWSMVREEAGCPDLWIRDLRRTFATVGLSHGEKIGVIGELLNHKSDNTTKIYAKLSNDIRFQVAGNIAGKVAELLNLRS